MAELAKADQLGADPLAQVDQRRLVHRLITSQRWAKSSTGITRSPAGAAGTTTTSNASGLATPSQFRTRRSRTRRPARRHGSRCGSRAARGWAAGSVGGPTHAADAKPTDDRNRVGTVEARPQAAEVEPSAADRDAGGDQRPPCSVERRQV